MNAVLKPLSFEFRPMLGSDVEDVIRIERAAYPYPWTQGNFRDSLDSGYSCWLAEIDGKPAGYWIMMLAVGEGHILNCCVAPDWQGRGFGRLLVEHLIETARGHGTECLYLEVRPSNTVAVFLYQRLGFETIALRRGYYPADQGSEDALVMRLLF
ncbi:MAG: ribosomal-protein-alanine N-acetyltransferase [Hydrogenophilales bacterium 28-61-23]|nr:MAG: ribosomal-protein-alanine N-acetyltransferase [Hydrogenophilales bacterium 28-61-23]